MHTGKGQVQVLEYDLTAGMSDKLTDAGADATRAGAPK